MRPAATLDDAGARAAVLREADRVFYDRGVAAVGMAEIRDSSGVSLRRLYQLYPSKRDLVAGWLAERHRTWTDWFAASVERHRAAGADPILAAFDAIAEWASTPGFRGCAFLNTAAETSEIDETHRVVIASHKRELIAYLAGLGRSAGYERADVLAEQVAVLVDGAIVQAAVLASTRPVAAARDAAARLVETYR